MRVIEVDLREQPKGCKEHPLIRLKREAESLSMGEELRVVSDEDVVPLEAIRIIASRAGLKLTKTRIAGKTLEVVLRKNRQIER